MIEIKHLYKSFETSAGTVEALKDINLTIEDGDIYGIIGMSGAGKSTLVRCINMLERPTEGSVIIGGKNMGMLKPGELREARRDITMIFQGFNLLMQRNCLRNICFPLELAGMKKAEAKKKAMELLELVGLPDKAKNYPAQLSGGQQQRVGLARALAAGPSLMLLDEPFGAIDAINRTKLQDELLKIHERAGLTCMFVTHDVTEALKLGTRIMIMNQGKIQQFDTAKEILEHPANEYVASLLQSVQEGLNFFR